MVDVSDIAEGDINAVWERHEETFGETYSNWRAMEKFDGPVIERLLRKALIEDRPLTNETLHAMDADFDIEDPGPEFTL